MIPEIRPGSYLRVTILALISLSFLNMLYCTMAYEFGWGPATVLPGPEDRFADVIKLSLSFRTVTDGADHTEKFKSWKPVYQHYYEHPDYGGIEALSKGELTHFHHPPLTMLILLATGAFIVRVGSPSITLFLFFSIYLLEVASVIWIGIPRARRNLGLILGIWFLCLASYPALVIFGRGNYINAGLTTLPIVAFLTAIFGRKQASLPALFALAVAVNIHPNAIIFLLALPLMFGIHRTIKPALQLAAIAGACFGLSYVVTHKLYPDYTIANFQKGVAIYGKAYIAGGGGVRLGSSLFGLIRSLNRGLHLGIPFPVEMTIFYVLATLALLMVGLALYRVLIRGMYGNGYDDPLNRRGKSPEWRQWPLPLIPFFLVSLYCILSPIFADYHLLVFIAPLIVAFLEPETAKSPSRLLTLVVLTSIVILSPKNYLFEHASVQILLNPLILYGVVVWLSIALLSEQRRPVRTAAAFHVPDGR